jgi:deoxyadenosine/deoxycytidine kinase
MRKTLIVNLLAGPGAGKSTLAASIFAELKWRDVECELATEYAKDLVWEKRHNTLSNQIYVFGKQHHRLFRLLGQVDVIVTDSPLFLTPIYAPELKTLTKLAMEEIDKLNNLNVFIARKKKYNPNGRNQNRAQAVEIDEKIKSFLDTNKVPYIEIEGTPNGIKCVVDEAVKLIYENK